jgi:GT2 family glycosyltransferase
MVSLVLLTIDRYEMTRDVLDQNLARAGYPFELLVADNGSQDRRVIDYIQSLGPAVHILNRENKGVARMLNVLYKLSQGQYICTLAPDIRMPDQWLARLVETYQRVPNAGAASFHCVESPGVPTEVAPGVVVDLAGNIFGPMFISRRVLDWVGYYNEMFNPYGMEDADYHARLAMAGLVSFYIHGDRCEHLGHDWGEDSDYRRGKDKALAASAAKWGTNLEAYRRTGRYHIDAGGQFIIDQQQFFQL